MSTPPGSIPGNQPQPNIKSMKTDMTILIPIIVGVIAMPFLGINPLKVLAGLSLLWLALLLSTL